MSTKTRATITELYKVAGKAELVNGEIVHMSPTVRKPGRKDDPREFAAACASHGGGYAYPNNVGFAVHLPHRESFSPGAAWYVGPDTGMEFCDGAPTLAVAVRSKEDYGSAAERAMAQKRADYFACGTLVVWDVDFLSLDVIRSYKASTPEGPAIFRRGDIADAEPAVPGWRMAVEELFG
jgi:Uma2 family endonuclease